MDRTRAPFFFALIQLVLAFLTGARSYELEFVSVVSPKSGRRMMAVGGRDERSALYFLTTTRVLPFPNSGVSTW